jgi:hypothetical protein
VPQEGFVDLLLASVPSQKSPLDAKSMVSGFSIGKSPRKMTKVVMSGLMTDDRRIISQILL